MPRPSPRLGDDIHLEPRDMPAVNPLAVSLDGQSAYDTMAVRVLQEVQDVRVRLDALAPGQAATDAVLREELAEALELTAGLTPFSTNDLLFGQPIETITVQPTLRLDPQPGGWNYDVGGTNLPHAVEVLQNNQLIGTIPVGADTGARFSLPSGQHTIVLRDAVTRETLGTAVLKTYGSSINVLQKNVPPLPAYQQARPLVATTSVPVARAELDGLFADLGAVWTPSASTILTQAELIAARARLLAGTVNDETTMKNALLAAPGVEAVVKPTLAFQVAYNNNGGRVLVVDGANLPEGSRLDFSSDPGLLNVLDERSFLPGSNHAEVAVGAASHVGLVDASGDLLGQSFSLSVESGYLIVRQGQAIVGMTGSTFAPAAIAGVHVPLTKDSLTAVSPQARLVVSGQKADLRFEWLPVGAVIEGLTNTPIVAAGGTLNVPIFVPNGTQREVTVRSAEGEVLMDRHMVGSNGQGGFIFYRPTSGQTQFITARAFGAAQLATREQLRTVESGRTTLTTRVSPVFPSGSTEVSRSWGLQVAGMAGFDLVQSRSQIARSHSALVALWEDDREGFYAEVNRRYEATPIQSGRKIETAGMIESRMKGEVFDAYARADEAINEALPVLADIALAAYLNVQATRTDTPPPPNLANVRTYTVQARNAAPLLPSDQQLLVAIGAHFDQIRSYLAGETNNWRNEVNEASIAGRITSDPNPGLRLPKAPELIAYEDALSAVSEAERQLRLATAAGEPRRLSAARVALLTAQAELRTAEAEYRRTADRSPQLMKQRLENGDVITVLNKAALEYVLAGLSDRMTSAQSRLQGLASDSPLYSRAQAELTHWQTLQTAAQGLLGLVPAGQTVPVISTPQARAWLSYLERTTTDPAPAWDVGTVVSGESLKAEQTFLTEYGFASASFTVTEEKMLNLWIDDHVRGDLRLLRSDGSEVWAPRIRGGNDGESFSGVLAPGTYRIELTSQTGTPLVQWDLTSAEYVAEVAKMAQAALAGVAYDAPTLKATLHLELTPRSWKQIEGRVSRDGSPEVLPVRLSVAEFNGDNRKNDFASSVENGGVRRLDPSKPVWVVVHGRGDREDSDSMNELARSLTLQGVQVVTVDWSAGASQNFPDIMGLQGNGWIPVSAKWVANQLRSLGITDMKQVHAAGHSWGTYFINELARELGGIGTIVALDPANDSQVLGSQFNTDSINFSQYSERSLSFLSSRFGDATLARTADVWFNLSVQEGYEGGALDHLSGSYANLAALAPLTYGAAYVAAEAADEILDANREHNFAVTTFTSIMTALKDNLQSGFLTHFQLDRWMSGLPAELPSNFGQVGYEMRIDPYLADSSRGPQTWWKSLPISLKIGLDDELFPLRS